MLNYNNRQMHPGKYLLHRFLLLPSGYNGASILMRRKIKMKKRNGQRFFAECLQVAPKGGFFAVINSYGEFRRFYGELEYD
jgi:hypothetical protein